LNRRTLQDQNFRTIGYIDTRSDGTEVLLDANFRTKGYYDPRRNATTDENFRTLGYGNLLVSLLPVYTSTGAPASTSPSTDQKTGGGGFVIVAFIIVAILDAPGIAFNYATDRFAHDPDGLLIQSLKDPTTWVISVVVWVLVAVIIYRLFGTRPARRMGRESVATENGSHYRESSPEAEYRESADEHAVEAPLAARDAYLRVLDLAPNASSRDITRSYRELAQIWHPDHYNHNARLRARAEEKMKAINEAYQALSQEGLAPETTQEVAVEPTFAHAEARPRSSSGTRQEAEEERTSYRRRHLRSHRSGVPHQTDYVALAFCCRPILICLSATLTSNQSLQPTASRRTIQLFT